MTTILLIIHLLIALALVGVILLQRSEGGALGIGGGGFGGLMTGRSSANLLTRTTAFLARASSRRACCWRSPRATAGRRARSSTSRPRRRRPAAPETPAEPSAPLAD